LTTHRRVRQLSFVALVAALAACSALLVAVAPGAGAASSNTLTVTAGEYAYKLAGNPQPGWVEIEFVNGGVEMHMMAVAKLKPGVTDKQLEKAALANDDKAFQKIAAGSGDVFGVPDLIGPNQQTTTIAQLGAGHYGMLCFVPAPDGSPHAAHGMVKVFDVKGSKSSYKPPQDGVQDVTLTDSAITLPSGGLTAHATAKVTNSGKDPHTFTLIKLETGKALADAYTYFNAFFEGGKATGAAPGTIVGGVSDVKPGGTAYVELNLTPGHYGYVSTDGDSPNDDYAKGLKGEFDIK
jgi:hypothetical protein